MSCSAQPRPDARVAERLAGWSLIIGSVLGAAGYLAGFIVNGTGPERFGGPSWPTLYTIALFGDVLIILGLPAIFRAQRGRSPRLTLIGYIGVLVPLVVLNIGEGAIEGFAKPYLADRGGYPSADLPGLAGFEAPALLIMIPGLICLGVAVFRAGVLPRFVGVLLIISPLLGIAGLPGAAALLSDWVLFAALCTMGVGAVRHRPLRAGSERVAGSAPSRVEV